MPARYGSTTCWGSIGFISFPHGFAPNHGVYVQMPFEALLAVTAQESVAHQCIVIGEDLGTVPDGFRDTMMDWGIWSYRVMMFERDYHAGFFHGIDHYPADALVTFNTHDLATFAGWRTGHDLELKWSLGIDPGESRDSRHHAVHMLGEVLRHHGIEHAGLFSAVNFLARTPGATAGGITGRPAGCRRPAQCARHRRPTSELAPAIAGQPRSVLSPHRHPGAEAGDRGSCAIARIRSQPIVQS